MSLDATEEHAHLVREALMSGRLSSAINWFHEVVAQSSKTNVFEEVRALRISGLLMRVTLRS